MGGKDLHLGCKRREARCSSNGWEEICGHVLPTLLFLASQIWEYFSWVSYLKISGFSKHLQSSFPLCSQLKKADLSAEKQNLLCDIPSLPTPTIYFIKVLIKQFAEKISDTINKPITES